MGFYGNITNVNKSTFQFDKTYPNRTDMDASATSDGVFVGRYVLVDYDEGSTVASIIQELRGKFDVDISDDNFVIAYKRMWYSNDEKKYLNELDKYGQVILQPSVSDDPTAERYGIDSGVIINDKTFALVIGAIKIKKTTVKNEKTGASDIVTTSYLDLDITPEVYYCTKFKGIDDYEVKKDENGNPVKDEQGNIVYELDKDGEKIPIYKDALKTELITDLVAPSGLYKNVYIANYNRDAYTYGKEIGRGWDSTVWQKTYKDGKYRYVMIAELNSVVPTFDITTDAPTETPLKPHYDVDNSNLYYKLHFQPSWGMRIKAAGGDAAVDNYSIDKKLYPSDLTGRFVTDSEVKYDQSPEHHQIVNKEVQSTPLAIYFDKKSFDKYWDSEVYHIKDEGTKSAPAEDGIYVTPSGYSDNEYYSPTTIEYNLVPNLTEEEFKLDTYYYKDKFDKYLRADSFNKDEQYYKQVTVTRKAPVRLPDTYELSIMLPSIGQSVSQMWDTIYGVGSIKDSAGNYLWDKETLDFADKDNKTFIRNTDVRWNSKLGLRSLDYPKGYINEKFSSLAGAINSVHDLMGMIIIAPKAPEKKEGEHDDVYAKRFASWCDGLLSPDVVAEWDPTKIYEIPVYKIINDKLTIVGQKFYRKSKKYSYNDNYSSQQDLNFHISEEDFVEANVIDVKSGNYYRLDTTQLPKYYDEDGAGAKELSDIQYNNYIHINENSPVYEGATYGTVNFYDKNVVSNDPKPVELSAEGYEPNTLYFRTKEEGIVPEGAIGYKLDTNGLPSATDGVYYKLTVGESTKDKKFYYPNTYYLGLVKAPNPQRGWEWNEQNQQWTNDKKDWTSDDFDSIKLCSENSLADILMEIPLNGTSDTTYGYKFFEGIDVSIKETDTLIENENSPILRRGVIGEYNNDLESSRRDIVVYTTDYTNNKIERARYIYNAEKDTWDFTFKYDIITDEETGTSYGQFNANGAKAYIERIPNSEAFVNGSVLNLYTYSCVDSPSDLSGFTLAEIVAQTSHHLNLKENGTPRILYNLTKKQISIYNFDNAETVDLEDFDISSNYYYNTPFHDPDYPGGEAGKEAWAKDHNNNYQYWVQETLSGDGLKERLKTNEYYKITAEKTAVYYNLTQGYYYKDAYNNYVKETATRIKPPVNNPDNKEDYKPYYRFIEQNDATGAGFKFTPITAEPFIENKFYYKPDENGPYVLATHYEDGVTYYKKTNALYVKSTNNDYLQVGAEWNKAVNTLPEGVTLSHRTESWGCEELAEFADRYNTINGLILNLYKKLLPNDTLTRDLTTVQGSINVLNDIIDKFNELVPSEIVMVDEYGRIHSANKDSEQSVTAINYGIADKNSDSGFAAGVVENIEDKTKVGKNADDERWIKLTTTDGEAPDYKPHIKLEHTLNHKVTPTATAADKNTPYTDSTIPEGNNGLGLNNSSDDTLKLYTPIVDNMGHIVGNNTETVTLPYGFKSITTNGRASNNNTADVAAQENIVADNTQDTIGINSGNEWIRVETDPANDVLTIYHDAKKTGTSSASVNLSNELDGTMKFVIPEDSFDSTNHFSNKLSTTYTLPNSYGKFTGDNNTVVSEATATHDTFSVTGDTWITTTVSKDSIALTHSGAHAATTSAGENGANYQFGSTFKVLNVGIDDKGHVKNLSTHDVKIPQGSLVDAAANGADVITQLSFDKPTGQLSSTRTNVGALALTGYNLNNNGSSETAIVATDTLNTALQRIEYRLNKEISDRNAAIDGLDSSYTATGASVQTGITSASTVNAISKIDLINGKVTDNGNDNRSVLVDAAGAAAAAKSELLGASTDAADANTIFGLKALVQQTAANAKSYADGLAVNYDAKGAAAAAEKNAIAAAEKAERNATAAATQAEKNAIAAISTTEFTYTPLVENPDYDSSDPTSEKFIRDETQNITKTIGDWITYIMDKLAQK